MASTELWSDLNESGLAAGDLRYLARRRRLLRAWPWVGGSLLLVLLGVGAWLYLTRPRLADPGFVWRALEAGTLDPATLSLLAALVPVLLLGLLGLAALLILMGFAVAANERRMLRLLDEVTGPRAPVPPQSR